MFTTEPQRAQSYRYGKSGFDSDESKLGTYREVFNRKNKLAHSFHNKTPHYSQQQSIVSPVIRGFQESLL